MKFKMEEKMKVKNLKTLENIKQAWREIALEKYTKMRSEDFLKEISKW